VASPEKRTTPEIDRAKDVLVNIPASNPAASVSVIGFILKE
jgi:hypothetical protein